MKKVLVTASALLVGASIALAQEGVSTAATPKPSPLPGGAAQAERVVVSGGAIERSETDTAQAVTILSEDNLKVQTQPTLRDAARRRRERFQCRCKSSGHSRSGGQSSSGSE